MNLICHSELILSLAKYEKIDIELLRCRVLLFEVYKFGILLKEEVDVPKSEVHYVSDLTNFSLPKSA